MKGTNVLILNQVMMRQVVQEWLNKHTYTVEAVVTDVAADDTDGFTGRFVVELCDPEAAE